MGSLSRRVIWFTTMSAALCAPFAAPLLADVVLSPEIFPIMEGVPLSNVTLATFTDTNLSDVASDFSVDITWGDGTLSTATITGGNGAFSVLGSHTYADEGSITYTIPLELNGALVLSANVTTPVQDTDTYSSISPVSLPTVAPGQVFSGVLVSLTDSNSNNVASDFTSTINWGDGSTSSGTVVYNAGAISVSGTHSYGSSGKFFVTASLADDPPGVETVSVTEPINVTTSTVPEPSTLSLLVVVVTALLLVRADSKIDAKESARF